MSEPHDLCAVIVTALTAELQAADLTTSPQQVADIAAGVTVAIAAAGYLGEDLAREAQENP